MTQAKQQTAEEMLTQKIHAAAETLNSLFRIAASSRLVINGNLGRSRYEGDRSDSSVLRVKVLKEIGEPQYGDSSRRSDGEEA